MKKISALVLTGGRGERMNGDIPKVLNKLNGKPLVFWTLDLLKKLNLEKTVIVTGYKSDIVKKAISAEKYDVEFIKQRKPLGTANAVKIGLKKIAKIQKNILVIYGDDSCLYKAKTIKKMMNYHARSNYPLTIMTLKNKSTSPAGGVERDNKGNVIDVLSPKEVRQMNLRESEILCGLFLFNLKWLRKNIKRIKKGPLRGEYPLPLLIKMAADEINYCGVYSLSDSSQWCSINTLSELKKAERKMKNMKI